SHLPGPWVTKHQRGFTHVHPSGLPLACAPGWDGRASASAPSSAPRSYPRRTSGRGLALNTGQELCHPHHRPSNRKLTHSMRPRVARPQPSHHPRTTAPTLPSTMPKHFSSQRENHQRPNKAVLTPDGGTTSQQRFSSPGHQQGHDLPTGLKVQAPTVLTCWRPPDTESAGRRTRYPLLGAAPWRVATVSRGGEADRVRRDRRERPRHD